MIGIAAMMRRKQRYSTTLLIVFAFTSAAWGAIPAAASLSKPLAIESKIDKSIVEGVQSGIPQPALVELNDNWIFANEEKERRAKGLEKWDDEINSDYLKEIDDLKEGFLSRYSRNWTGVAVGFNGAGWQSINPHYARNLQWYSQIYRLWFK